MRRIIFIFIICFILLPASARASERSPWYRRAVSPIVEALDRIVDRVKGREPSIGDDRGSVEGTRDTHPGLQYDLRCWNPNAIGKCIGNASCWFFEQCPADHYCVHKGAFADDPGYVPGLEGAEAACVKPDDMVGKSCIGKYQIKMEFDYEDKEYLML